MNNCDASDEVVCQPRQHFYNKRQTEDIFEQCFYIKALALRENFYNMSNHEVGNENFSPPRKECTTQVRLSPKR